MNKTKIFLLSCTLALVLCFAPFGAGEDGDEFLHDVGEGGEPTPHLRRGARQDGIK